ncbi:MAG TPA: hypothetical protein GXX19_08900 [Syntrophomonadaceae bacterium]|nr:hypothetical protein [Syntrophomonadaceae bacterium]
MANPIDQFFIELDQQQEARRRQLAKKAAVKSPPSPKPTPKPKTNAQIQNERSFWQKAIDVIVPGPQFRRPVYNPNPTISAYRPTLTQKITQEYLPVAKAAIENFATQAAKSSLLEPILAPTVSVPDKYKTPEERLRDQFVEAATTGQYMPTEKEMQLLTPEEQRQVLLHNTRIGRAAGVAGNIAGATLPMMLSGLISEGAVLPALGRAVPQATRIGKYVPQIAKTLGREATTGLVYTGLESGLTGRAPSGREALQNALFFGVGGMGGELAGQAMQRFTPWIPATLQAGVHGAATGAAGMAGAYLATTPEERQNYLAQMGQTAASLGLYAAAMAGAGRVRPGDFIEKVKKVRASLDDFRKARTASEMQDAYTRFWNDVNEAYDLAARETGLKPKARTTTQQVRQQPRPQVVTPEMQLHEYLSNMHRPLYTAYQNLDAYHRMANQAFGPESADTQRLGLEKLRAFDQLYKNATAHIEQSRKMAEQYLRARPDEAKEALQYWDNVQGALDRARANIIRQANPVDLLITGMMKPAETKTETGEKWEPGAFRPTERETYEWPATEERKQPEAKAAEQPLTVESYLNINHKNMIDQLRRLDYFLKEAKRQFGQNSDEYSRLLQQRNGLAQLIHRTASKRLQMFENMAAKAGETQDAKTYKAIRDGLAKYLKIAETPAQTGQRPREKVPAAGFQVGDRITWTGAKNKTRVGTITKIGKNTITVTLDDGTKMTLPHTMWGKVTRTVEEQKLTPYDTPEIIQARAEQANMPSTHLINTPERQALRQRIADELYGNGAAKKEGKVFLIMGLPASGKSSLADPIAEREGALVIDSDKVKEILPEYEGGKYAGAVHKESGDIVENFIMPRALENKDNIVLPVVGKDLKKMRERIDLFKAAGYKVHLVFTDLPVEKAVERAIARWKSTGRFVDPAYIVNEVGLLPRQNYDILKSEKGVDSYEAYSTDVPQGESPRLLEKSPARSKPGSRRRILRGRNNTSTEEVSGEEKTAAAYGKTSVAKTERGTTIKTQYAVVNAEDLVSSHDTAFKVNPEFPRELQPRDRSRAASIDQVTRIVGNLEPEFLGESPKASEGAPIVGKDMVVESGNARVIALKKAYEDSHPNIEKYRQWLIDNADRFGLKPEDIEKVKNPVLVRVRQSDVDRVQFVREANEQAVAAMSATEQAKADAEKMSPGTLSLFQLNESGEILTAANMPFIRAFFDEVVPPVERGRYMNAKGEISQEGIIRIRNAIFARAYGDITAIERLAESTDNNVRNITTAMLAVAPDFAKIKDGVKSGAYFDLDITRDIVDAVNKLSELRASNMPVEAYLRQVSLVEDLSPLAKNILRIFDKEKRSAKKLTAILRSYTNLVHAMGSPRQMAMFERIQPTKEEVLGAAVRRAEESEEVPRLFDDQGQAVGGVAAPGVSENEGKRGSGEKGQKGLSKQRVQGSPRRVPGVTKTQSQITAAGERPQSRVAIINYLEDRLGIPVREGRMWHSDSAGEYEVKPEVIRSRKPEDLPTIAHEVGHHLVKFLGLKPNAYAAELWPLGDVLYPQASDTVKLNEGMAEFFRLYFVDPAEAKKAAPNFFRDIEARFDAEKEVGEIVHTAQKMYQDWYAQDAVNHVKSVIVREEPRAKKWLSKAEQLYADWVDDLYPIWKATKQALGKKANPERDLEALQNPYTIARLARGRFRKAWSMLVRAQVSPDLKIIGPSFQEILKPVRKNIDDFTAYITAKRAVELHDRGIATGMDPIKAKLAVQQLETPEFKKAQQELLKYQDNLIDHLVDAGVLSQYTADLFKQLNKDYVPFYRYFGEETASKGLVVGSKKRWADLPQPVKRIKGSERSIYDPLQSIMRNTIYLIDIAERNRVARAFADIFDKAEGMGWLASRVKTPVEPTEIELKRLRQDLINAGIPEDILDQADLKRLAVVFRPVQFARIKEKKENILTVYRNGEPVFYQVHPELYRALEMLDAPSTHWFIQLLSFPAQILRAGATLTPEFIARNPSRDQLSAFLFSKYHYVPIVDFFKGLFHVVKRDNLYKLWEASGGAASALVSLDRDYLNKNLKDILGKRTALDWVKVGIRSPLSLLQAISEAMEEATRVGVFAKAAEKEGWTREGLSKAAYGSREATVDFSRAGYKGRQANQIIAFFNAGIQGPNRMYRAMKEDPAGFAIKAGVIATVSLILYLMNKDDPRYQELPAWRRDLYWVIPGEKNQFFIPKPFEPGILFGTAIERALDYVNEKDPKALKQLAKTAWDSGTPNILPTAIIPIIEWYSNRSLFTGRPIVPMREQGLEPYEQYGPYTTETAKAIGKAANLSPRKLEAGVRGYTGGLGMHVLRLLDFLSGHLPKEVTTSEVLPIVQSYMGKPYRNAESVDRFYDRLAELERKYKTWQKNKKEGEPAERLSPSEMSQLYRMRRLKKLITERQERIRKIEKSENYSPDERRRMIDHINLEIVNLARIGLGKERIEDAG